MDGTCGNGGDTAFLASRGAEVLGIDLQETALRATAEKLRETGTAARLVRADHADLDVVLTQHGFDWLDAAIFNLGYLPGGDRSIRTRPESTIAALGAVLDRAVPGFRLAAVAYRGHTGGRAEAEAVHGFLSGLPTERFRYEAEDCDGVAAGPVLHRVEALRCSTD